MVTELSSEQYRTPVWPVTLRRTKLPVALLIPLLLAGCSDGSDEPQQLPTSSPGAHRSQESSDPAVVPHPSTTAIGRKIKEFRFNALDAEPLFINAYPGVTNLDEHRTYNFTYDDGEYAKADCFTTGREVSSRPEDGDNENITSDLWLHVRTPPPDRYASIVFVHDREELLAGLPLCPKSVDGK
jgi:hypothetical protein